MSVTEFLMSGDAAIREVSLSPTVEATNDNPAPWARVKPGPL